MLVTILPHDICCRADKVQFGEKCPSNCLYEGFDKKKSLKTLNLFKNSFSVFVFFILPHKSMMTTCKLSHQIRLCCLSLILHLKSTSTTKTGAGLMGLSMFPASALTCSTGGWKNMETPAVCIHGPQKDESWVSLWPLDLLSKSSVRPTGWIS